MCVLSATQVLASALNKVGQQQEISLSRLIKYNKLLLEKLTNYYNIIDLYDLSFEIASVASEFEMVINEKHERIIRLCRDAEFDYSLYVNTMPDGIANQLEEIEVPV